MTHYSLRYASHPEDAKSYDTQKIRDLFLIDTLFTPDDVNLVYSMYDRFIVGGVMPVQSKVALETIPYLRSDYFLERRELGIVNVGGMGRVTVDGEVFELAKKEALYIGSGKKEVFFESLEDQPALFYLNSATAHQAFPTKKISKSDAIVIELGEEKTANKRILNKLIVNELVATCQLQMGLTELLHGNVWNTMPSHTHIRRMEAYFYFDIPEGQTLAHFMGEPQETRHIFIQNNQAVLSPEWSIHSGAGTSNYSFIWGMAGENLDYSDMDVCPPNALR
jgi:4-deoxy-L-threo-5-hexosulose-uronate ketol-isomerase